MGDTYAKRLRSWCAIVDQAVRKATGRKAPMRWSFSKRSAYSTASGLLFRLSDHPSCRAPDELGVLLSRKPDVEILIERGAPPPRLRDLVAQVREARRRVGT